MTGASIANRFDTISSEIRSLEQAVARERSASSHWRERAEQMGKRLHTVEVSERQLLKQVSQLTHTSSTALKENSFLNAEYTKARNALDQYRKVWAEFKKREEAARKALSENGNLRQQVQSLSHQLSQLQELLRQESVRLEEATRRGTQLESNFNGTQDRIQSLETRNLALSKELQAAQELCRSYEAQLTRLTEQSRSREAALRLVMERELKTEFDLELARARARTAEEVQRARIEERDLVTSETEDRYRKEIFRLKTEYEQTVAEERKKSEESAAHLTRESSRRNEEFSRISREKSEFEKTCEILKDEKAESQRQSAALALEIHQKDQELARARSENHDRQKQIDALTNDRQERDQRIFQLQQQTTARTDEIARLQQELDSAAKIRPTLEGSIRKLESKLEQAKSTLSRAEARAAAEHSAARRAGEEFGRQNARLSALRRECELLQTALFTQLTHFRDLGERIEICANELPENSGDFIAELAQELQQAANIPTFETNAAELAPVRQNGKTPPVFAPSKPAIDC